MSGLGVRKFWAMNSVSMIEFKINMFKNKKGRKTQNTV